MNDETPGHQPDGAGILERFAKGLSLTLLAVLAVVLVVKFASWASAVSFAVRYPSQIDYGEGIVWQQALLILGGEGYSDITRLPFVVFHYPPVFHLLSGLFAGTLNIDFLAAGRLVSVVSTLGSTIVIGVLIFGGTRARGGLAVGLICAFAAGLMAFLFEPVAKWSPVMRVDMAAIFLSYLGIYFGLRAPEHPRSVYVSALFFVLAMYTKQTAIAAPLATILVLMAIRPRLAGRGFITALGLGLVAMFGLQWSTDGGFLEHIVSYNINRFELSRLQFLILPALQHFLYLLIVASFVAGFFVSLARGEPGRGWLPALRQNVSSDPYERLRCFGGIYILLTTLSLAAITKSGGSTNYLLEWMFTWSIAIGLLLRWPVSFALGSFRSARRPETVREDGGLRQPLLRFGFPVLISALLVQALLVSPPAYWGKITDPAYQQQQSALVQRVREASKPVIGDDMVAVLRSGKQVVWEPAIFAELAVLGRWDEEPFIEMIRSNNFAFFITDGLRGDPIFDSRYTAPVLDAIESAYPRKQRLAGYVLHLPPE